MAENEGNLETMIKLIIGKTHLQILDKKKAKGQRLQWVRKFDYAFVYQL